jgi:hypothetical protein
MTLENGLIVSHLKKLRELHINQRYSQCGSWFGDNLKLCERSQSRWNRKITIRMYWLKMISLFLSAGVSQFFCKFYCFFYYQQAGGWPAKWLKCQMWTVLLILITKTFLHQVKSIQYNASIEYKIENIHSKVKRIHLM